MPAAIGLVDLGVFLALAFLIALSYAYRYSLGAALVALANVIGAVRLPGILGGGRIFGFLADALTGIDNEIRHALGVGIAALQTTWNEAVSYTAQAIHWIGHEIGALAHDTAQAVETLSVRQVTNVYKKVNPGLARRVGALAAVVAALSRQLEHVVGREAHTAKAKAQAVEHAIAQPDIGAIPKALPGVRWLDHEARWARGQIKRLARYLTPAGIIGLVGATTFSQFGLSWLRCKGVGRVGRSLCGLSGLIESLYADAITAFAVTDLCRFAYGIERVAEAIRPLMLAWVDVENALLGCSRADFPADLPEFLTSPTPVFDPVAL